MIKLTYFEGVTDRKGRSLSWQALWDFMHGQRMKWDIEAIRNGDESLKRSLPAVTWQANYDGTRQDNNALATGLFMLDVDHISHWQNFDPSVTQAENTALALYEKYVKGREDELDIVLYHRSPSGDGAHIVALCQPQWQDMQVAGFSPRKGIDLANNQAWLAAALGIQYDTVCHDWARLGFLSVAEDFYYIDKETLFG